MDDKFGSPPLIRGTPEQIADARAKLDEWVRQGAIEQHRYMQRILEEFSKREQAKRGKND